MPVCKILCFESAPFLTATAPVTAGMFTYDDNDPILQSWRF